MSDRGGTARSDDGSIQWQGQYPSWQSALANSMGYDTPVILEHLTEAALKVQRGEASYERDAVAFASKEYAWPLLACLLRIALEGGGRSIRVLDFGGSLGTTYWQLLEFFTDCEVRWGVVEQPHIAARGNEIFRDGRLSFHTDIEECARAVTPDVVLASGVLQCVADPHGAARRLVALGAPNIVLDRTALVAGDGPDWLTVEHVPKEIYPASYPSWFLNRDDLLDDFQSSYDLVCEFDSFCDPPLVIQGRQCVWRGFYFRRQRP